MDLGEKSFQDVGANSLIGSRTWLESGGFTIKGANTHIELRNQDSNTKDNLVGAPPQVRDIWVYKIAQGNVYTMMKYLKDKNIKVGKITRASHVDSTYKSFRIKIFQHDVEKVLSRGFWPLNVKFNGRDFSRNHPSTNS